MFSFILFWTLQATPAAAAPLQAQPSNDSITIFGSCWDISTGVDLPASTTAIIGGKKVYIGKSNEEGKFDLRIPVSTENLIFEMKGYRPVSRPVNILGKTKGADRFPISIRMISLDSQQVLKSFQKTDKILTPRYTKQKTMVPQTLFEIKDAYNNKSVKAKACLVYSKTGQTQCFETDTSRLPKPVDLLQDERISLHVTADGFEGYSGDLLSSNVTSLYHIKLLRAQNPVSLYLDAPDSLDINYILGQNNRRWMEHDFKRKTHRKNILLDVINHNANFTGTYQIVVVTGRKTYPGEESIQGTIAKAKSNGNFVLLNDSATATTGLNFWAIHVDGPSPEMIADILKPTSYTATPFEKRTLYFSQSSYGLSTNTKLTLDSISEFLLKQRKAKAHLTGHTDNVGRRELNVALSEYRARVVAHYLQNQGVPKQQIIYNWKGPDAPVAANDTEANKVRNRRVDLRVVGN